MRIVDVINFFYSKYEKLDLTIEYNNGIRGRNTIMTFDEALESIAGYENEPVDDIGFETHYHFCGKITREKEVPSLYIMYH